MVDYSIKCSSDCQGKGKGKGKGKSKAKIPHPVDQPVNKPEEGAMDANRHKLQKLRSLDVFAGCGGMLNLFHFNVYRRNL